MSAHLYLRAVVTALGVTLSLTLVGYAQMDEQKELLESTVDAPPNMRNLSNTLGGAYFVDEALLDRYEAVKARLTHVREEIASGNTTGDAALKSLAAIEEEMRALRMEIDQKKQLVSAFQVYSKKSEQTFPLGDERLVIITADDVTVRGWEGPGLKCVIEKTIVAKQEPAASAFDAIHVHHELTNAAGKVGLTRAERDKQEQMFLASAEGRKLTDEQKASRRKRVDEIHHSFDAYAAFQGREANTIELKGLSYDEGNRQLSLRIHSPDGGGLSSSQWQRHATMTIYVPPCAALAVRGCLGGLDVQDVEGDLVLTTHDSRDRNYDGSFKVQGVTGNVHIDQVPVRFLSSVTGHVRFMATEEFVNSGTLHVDNTRTFSTYHMAVTQIDKIQGGLQATFLRTDLRLNAIAGALDVVNSFGPTQLSLAASDPQEARRIVSECGDIRVQGSQQALTQTPLYAYTQCGRLHTNLPREVLDNVDFSTGDPRTGWHGFVTASEERFDFQRFERPLAALDNPERTVGLDLISRAGTVTIVTEEQEP